MDKNKIYDFINSAKIKDRDQKVLELISTYYKNNADALADGLINYHIVFGNTNRNRFYEYYQLDDNNFKEWKRKNGSVIKNKVIDDLLYLELFTSFCDTGNRTFLDMLSIVEIGSKMKKYLQSR